LATVMVRLIRTVWTVSPFFEAWTVNAIMGTSNETWRIYTDCSILANAANRSLRVPEPELDYGGRFGGRLRLGTSLASHR
jgi:hypothetical protein